MVVIFIACGEGSKIVRRLESSWVMMIDALGGIISYLVTETNN